MRYKESPDPGMIQPGSEDKVMQASFRVGETTVLFGALVEGGQVTMPLAATFFSPRFGMTTDRFGVSWMVYVAP